MVYRNYYEHNIVKWSMIVLFLSLVLVYIVLYYAKSDLWKQEINLNQSMVSNQDLIISDIGTGNGGLPSENLLTGELDQEVINTQLSDQQNLGQQDQTQEGIQENQIQEENQQNIEETNNDAIILSGTKSYYGELDFVEKLGISYDYALRDDKNIYYLNITNKNYDFAKIVRRLRGSLYVMNTEQEILSNNMFGDKVTYINIPEYKNNKVLLLVDIDNQSWLLAIDYSIYHQVKNYLKNLFID